MDTNIDKLNKLNKLNKLFEVSTTENLNMIKSLLDTNIDINMKYNDDMTLLTLACMNQSTHNNTDIVELLLEKNADPNTYYMTRHIMGIVCLSMRYPDTVVNNNINICKLLLDYKCDINKLRDGLTPFIDMCRYAVVDSSYDIIKILIDGGADVNLCNKNGRSPLMYICGCGLKFANFENAAKTSDKLIKLVDLLIKNNADINKTANNLNYPLLLACNAFHEKKINGDVIKFMLDNGANPLAIEKPAIREYWLFVIFTLDDSYKESHIKFFPYMVIKNLPEIEFYKMISFFNNYDEELKFELLTRCFMNCLLKHKLFEKVYGLFLDYDIHYRGIKSVLGIKPIRIKKYYDILLLLILTTKHKVINANKLSVVKKCIIGNLFLQ